MYENVKKGLAYTLLTGTLILPGCGGFLNKNNNNDRNRSVIQVTTNGDDYFSMSKETVSRFFGLIRKIEEAEDRDLSKGEKSFLLSELDNKDGNSDGKVSINSVEETYNLVQKKMGENHPLMKYITKDEQF